MLAMRTITVRKPVMLGAKVSWKVVLPPAVTLPAGGVARRKALASVPPIATSAALFSTSVALPVLRMVKVRVTLLPTVTLPKSVPSPSAGVSSPLLMLTPLPTTSLSGACHKSTMP